MTPSSSFKPDQSFSLLLQGPPKTGKTCIAMSFPKPWFLEADRNLRSAVEAFPGKEFWYDYPDTAKDGSTLPDNQIWERMAELVKDACLSPDPSTLILDSMTPIGRYLEEHVVRLGSTGKTLTVGGVKVMDLALWRPYKILMAKLIEMCKQSKKLLIVIVHDKDVEDRQSGAIRYKPNVGGEMKDVLYSLFTDVWRTDVEVVGATSKYIVQASPIARCESLTSTLSLPPKFEFFTKDADGKLTPTSVAAAMLKKLGGQS